MNHCIDHIFFQQHFCFYPSNISWLACCDDPFWSELTHPWEGRTQRLQTYCRQSLSVQESKTGLPKLIFPCHCLAAICMPFQYLLGINPLQTEKNPEEIFLCPGAQWALLTHIWEDLVETNDIPSFPAAKRSRDRGWMEWWSLEPPRKREERGETTHPGFARVIHFLWYVPQHLLTSF